MILPAYKGHWNVGWTKSGAIVPEKINGRYWMYFLGTSADKTDQMGLASSTDLIHWTEATAEPVLPRRPGQFDSRVVEPGPSPIVTKDGIVMVYNAADDKLVYRTAIAVFDRNDPRRLLWRSGGPVFSPENGLGKNRAGPECGLRRGHGPSGQELLLLLRGRRQIHRSSRSSGYAVIFETTDDRLTGISRSG